MNAIKEKNKWRASLQKNHARDPMAPKGSAELATAGTTAAERPRTQPLAQWAEVARQAIRAGDGRAQGGGFGRGKIGRFVHQL